VPWGDRLSEGEPHFGLRSRANGQKLRVMLVDERGKPVKAGHPVRGGRQGVAARNARPGAGQGAAQVRLT
jgi:hypothetical protein